MLLFVVVVGKTLSENMRSLKTGDLIQCQIIVKFVGGFYTSHLTQVVAYFGWWLGQV